jgi:hypothetical protein
MKDRKVPKDSLEERQEKMRLERLRLKDGRLEDKRQG